MKVLVTCPPMIGVIEEFRPLFKKHNIEAEAPNVVQTLSEKELIDIIPEYDGWIIGDDPATRDVFNAGKKGRLKAAVKWGIGTDNVDFAACNDLNIPITNTPDMFGPEVADVAMAYVTALARETHYIDREVRSGRWPKPCGISLSGKVVGLIGYGDIGSNTAKRLIAADMMVIAYDPNKVPENVDVLHEKWPNKIEGVDFLVVTCALTDTSRHLLNDKIFEMVKKGVRVVNVGRGPVIDENALERALKNGYVHSVALDVFENEPLPMDSYMRTLPKCIFGSHNSSNTFDAVTKTSELAINRLVEFLSDD